MTEAADRKKAGWPARLFELKGRTGILRREISTGWLVLPEGMKVQISGNSVAWSRLDIIGSTCECCGIKGRASRLSWRDIDIDPVVPLLDPVA